MFDLEIEGQGRRVQHSQWCHLMANIKFSKNQVTHFCDSSHRFGDINGSDMSPCQGHEEQHSQLFHSMSNINLYKSRT